MPSVLELAIGELITNYAEDAVANHEVHPWDFGLLRSTLQDDITASSLKEAEEKLDAWDLDGWANDRAAERAYDMAENQATGN